MVPCKCHSIPGPQPSGLGFDIDWGGIIGNAVKAYGTVQQTRSAITLQRAQQEAANRAQENELQLMRARQAQTIAQPAGGLFTTPAGQVVQIAPSGAMMPVQYAAPRSEIPSWAIPAAVGLGVLFLMRN
jgi:hypothetical protein